MDGGIIFILTLFVFAIFFSCWVLLETYKIENGLSFWNHLKIKHFLRKNEDIAKLIIKYIYHTLKYLPNFLISSIIIKTDAHIPEAIYGYTI